MTDISIFGAGAFGTALAIALAKAGNTVELIARSQQHADTMVSKGENLPRLAGFSFPDGLTISHDQPDPALICLLAVPTQSLAEFVRARREHLIGRNLVACCKGVDLASGLGPTGVILAECPTSEAAILSGPGFAADIAAGLPTALTIAAKSDETAKYLQDVLSTPTLRLYRTTDTTGVELGGALKNIMAIAAGIAIGAGLGESARAALITRGFAELKGFARGAGADPETLAGLSGFGDLVLTCTSEKSRNYNFGLSLGRGIKPDRHTTVEGVATAIAVSNLAETRDIPMPITDTIAQLVDNRITVAKAVVALLSRPLTKE